ncbi:hypothetical protein [Deinococcus roseus]|uniref:Uncharacterized protein n=1 Tax=Deinococcus roseus TaxID=392414 RepID=A0ABQ2DB08_9DEIO|nr:hypothetical protein [Deinococcus roseus]GGJ48260.1 hypothetical protein GCM10008938_37850 [Deinococcus roseus]
MTNPRALNPSSWHLTFQKAHRDDPDTPTRPSPFSSKPNRGEEQNTVWQ